MGTKGIKRLIIVLLILCAAVTPYAQGKQKYKFVMVCNVTSEPFWTTVRNGMKDAARLLNVDATFMGPQAWDVRKQREVFDTVIDTSPDGISVFLPDPDSMEPAIKTALSKGIPVIAFNNDQPGSARMAFIGQGEFAAGQVMGNELVKLVPKGSKVFAGNHHPGQTAIEERIRGVTSATKESGITVDQKVTPEMNPSETLTVLEGYYATNPDVKALLAFNPQVGSLMAKWVEEKGLKGKVVVASFDLLPQLLDYVKKGTVAFTIDQQPYLQGFQSIVELWLYKEYGLSPTNIQTGGAVITKNNVDQVVALTGKGIR